MSRFKHSSWYRLRYPVFAAILFGGFLLISFVLSAIGNSVQAQSIDPQSTPVISSDTDSPNVVASASADAINQIGDSLQNLQISTNNGLNTLGDMATHSRDYALHSIYVSTVASVQAVGKGVGAIIRVNATAAGLLLRSPENAIKLAGDTAIAQKVLRPSDHAEVPILDPNSPELKAAIAALPPTQNASQTVPATPASNAAGGPAWPIHGVITTEFGVVHWPYQPTHTGIDISDGQRPGVTPVHPFRPGRVIEVIHSNVSLGNHVVIDHGNGVTSVYGHMYSTAVQVGQDVDMSTVLGLEGSTGASTGTHVHLEIRVNGQATNPHQFIPGTP